MNKKPSIKEQMDKCIEFFRKHAEFNPSADIEADLWEECADAENEKDHALELISNMPVPLFVKDALVHDHDFDKAIKKLVEKGRHAESIEEIDKLTAAVLRLAK